MKKGFVLDARLLTLSFDRTCNTSDLHNEVLLELASFLNRRFSEPINFDHAESTLHKHPINLNYAGKRYDLGLLHKNKRILIDVEVVDL